MAKAARPHVRLLFDELTPWRVAAALRVLEVRASYVGNADDGAPPRGSSDSDVLEHARRTNQVIVTSNHDMVMLCAEEGHSVVWVDPWGRQFSRETWVLLAFTQLARWDELLSGQDQICVRALRSRCEAISLEAAYDMTERRLKALRARRAKRTRLSRVDPNQVDLPKAP